MTRLRIVMIGFLVASTIQAQNLDVPPTAAQLREWMGDECVRAGRRVGFDYPATLERAIRGEPAGLAEMLRYTVNGDVDGAAGEAHSAILLGLLQRWGDKKFAHVLRAQKPEIRKAVIATLPIPSADEHKFPFTYSSVPKTRR